MLLLPITRGADVMVCDQECLLQVAQRFPAVEPQIFDASEVCLTCHACGLTVPGMRCFCADFALSCSASSWLMTAQAVEALNAIFACCGPVALTDQDWEFLLDRAEAVDIGGLVGLLWVRDRHSEAGS